MKHALLVGTGIAFGILATLILGYARISEATVPPQSGPGAGSGTGSGGVVMATGGTSSSQNDICWLFFQDQSKAGNARQVLCCYKVTNGQFFDLIGVREVTYDMKPSFLPTNFKSKYHPKDLKKLWEKQK